MFPSNRNINGYYDPVHFTNDPSNFSKPFVNDVVPNSKLEDVPLSFSQFNFPFDDHDDYLHDLLLLHQQNQPFGTDNNSTTVSEIAVEMVDSAQTDLKNSSNVTTQQPTTRKTSGLKKDRHSKINTAKGLRDRRVRLSLEVAPRFFKLQDMLGYDKASKTVEWLLEQAKNEIEKLEGRHRRMVKDELKGRLQQKVNYSYSAGAKSSSSTDECEVASETHKGAINSGGSKPPIKEKKIRRSHKFIHRPLTRDMRNKARAKARERTSYKKMFGRSLINISNQSWSCSALEKCEKSGSRSPYRNCSLEVLPEVEEASCEVIANHEQFDDGSIVVMENWSPSSSFNYRHNIGTPEEVQF